MRAVAEEAGTGGVEAQVAGSGKIEDVHEEIEMMAFSFEGKVLDDAEVEVREERLTAGVARGQRSVEDGAGVPVVGRVFRVEADDGCIGRAGVGLKEGVELEAGRAG